MPQNIKRTVCIRGRPTSLHLEDQFWEQLRQIAEDRDMYIGQLVIYIKCHSPHKNLSSACRTFVLEETIARAA